MKGGLQIVEHELPSMCRYPKPLVLLVALIALAFASSTLQAQILTSTQENKFDKAARPASSVASYREPVITCTVGRAGFIGHGGRQAATIEMVAALAVAYVVFGGAILALVASFRLLGDKVDSFFAPLIPKPTVRTIAPPDEHFSPFKFKPSAKQEASRLASARQPARGFDLVRGLNTAGTVPAIQADRSTQISSIGRLSVTELEAHGHQPMPPTDSIPDSSRPPTIPTSRSRGAHRSSHASAASGPANTGSEGGSFIGGGGRYDATPEEAAGYLARGPHWAH